MMNPRPGRRIVEGEGDENIVGTEYPADLIDNRFEEGVAAQAANLAQQGFSCFGRVHNEL